jgi:tRNA-2-methylthio-N6-dimethylallyladenosine synthase
MDEVEYDFSYMFMYSERPGTPAAKRLKDDIPEAVKKRRLQEIIEKQQSISLRRNNLDLNKIHSVLVEGVSKRSDEYLQGRNPANKVIVFPREGAKKGQYVDVLVKNCTAATLIGEICK